MTKAEWEHRASETCRGSGFAVDSVRLIATWEQTFSGSDRFRHNAVFGMGSDRILKIFGTDAERHQAIERAALQAVEHAVPAPRLLHEGHDAWGSPFIIMTAVKGRTLQEAWSGLSKEELADLAFQIGRLTAAWHSSAQDGLAAVERRFGGKHETADQMAAERVAEVEAMTKLPSNRKKELIEFVQEEARSFIEGDDAFTHSDLSHAHLFIDREGGRPYVSGIIDWAEAMIGPAEWDLAFHWFWTFSGDIAAMRSCLAGYYVDAPRPERFARRCFATHLLTFSMREVWDYAPPDSIENDSIVRGLIERLFPSEVFGPPD